MTPNPPGRKPGRPPLPYGPSQMIRVPSAMVQNIRADIAIWKARKRQEPPI